MAQRDVAPEAQFGDQRQRGRSKRRVLLVGNIPAPVLTSLDQRGAELQRVPSLSRAFDAMLAETFDVVVVDPLCDGCGADLVTALKEPHREYLHTVATVFGRPGQAAFLRWVRPPSQEQFAELRERYAWTPFIVLPLPGEQQYAVIVRPPTGTELRHAAWMPVATSVMNVSVVDFMPGGQGFA